VPYGDDLSAPAAAPAARLFEAISRLRGRRGFHPFGAGFEGEVVPADLPPAGAPQLRGTALVRLSRSIGLPEWLPDPCGLGVRIADAHGPGRHQDLLLTSAGDSALGRRLINPSRGFGDRPYSSILPYEVGGRRVVVVARPLAAEAPGPLLADLRRRERADLEFRLGLAGRRGPAVPLATLRLGPRLPEAVTEELDLDPGNSGGGLEPVGFINRLRGPSYSASQTGRRQAHGRDAAAD
jgi:hypothetical protein